MSSPDSSLPRLVGRQVVLRPLTGADIGELVRILNEPGVEHWWGEFDADRVRAELVDADDSAGFAIECADEVIGLIQFAEEADPDYRHAGMDITIAGAHQGRGHGRDALVTLARYLIESRGHHRLTIDPRVDNTRAIAVYESIGFRPVGVLRQYERGTDGQWHDGLLMDLLADELRG